MYNNTVCSIINNTVTPDPVQVPYCWAQECTTVNSNICTNENSNAMCVKLVVNAQEHVCWAPPCTEETRSGCRTNYCDMTVDPSFGSPADTG